MKTILEVNAELKAFFSKFASPVDSLRALDRDAQLVILMAAREAIQTGLGEQRGFSVDSRESYEIACNALGLEALSDEACASTTIQKGDFTHPDYDIRCILSTRLALSRGHVFATAKIVHEDPYDSSSQERADDWYELD